MNNINMAEMFSIPPEYIEPQDIELKTNTQHPNLNSREYMKKFPDTTITIQKFYEKLIVNSEGIIILLSNNYTGRIWNGSLWGFRDFIDVGDQSKSLFKLQSASALTDICFVDNNTIIFSTANGAIQYWSTYSENTDPKTSHSLSLLGNRFEHTAIVNGVDVFRKERTKIVSVANDCSIKLWEISDRDLHSYNTMRHAHLDTITGVTTSNEHEAIFATCSQDKSVILWDYRQHKPATGLFENHICGFSAIYWTTEDEDKNMVVVGDDKGLIIKIDTRKPNEIVSKTNVFDRRIHKIRYNGTRLAVCGNTNELKLFDSTTSDLIYNCKKSQNFVRDVCWDQNDSNLFYSIDWDAKVKKHVLNRSKE